MARMGSNGTSRADCHQVRSRLRAFADDRLTPLETAEVQAHLRGCQSCAEAFAMLLLGDVVRGDIPSEPPPVMPPFASVAPFLDAHKDRRGRFWSSIREGLQSADAVVVDWARQRATEVAVLLSGIAPPRPRLSTRGNVSPTLAGGSPIVAPVLDGRGEPTGTVVGFVVVSSPLVTADGRFTMRLQTQAADYDGWTAVCTLTALDAPPLSFKGAIAPSAGGPARDVVIDEPGLPASNLPIPLDRLTLALVEA